MDNRTRIIVMLMKIMTAMNKTITKVKKMFMNDVENSAIEIQQTVNVLNGNYAKVEKVDKCGWEVEKEVLHEECPHKGAITLVFTRLD